MPRLKTAANRAFSLSCPHNFYVPISAQLKGTIKFGDNEFPNERTTLVEIKDIGSTKMDVPEAAKKKLS